MWSNSQNCIAICISFFFKNSVNLNSKEKGEESLKYILLGRVETYYWESRMAFFFWWICVAMPE